MDAISASIRTCSKDTVNAFENIPELTRISVPDKISNAADNDFSAPFDQPPYFVQLRELISDLPSADPLCIPPYSIIPDCPIPSEIEYYRHLLPNQLEKGLHDLDLMLLSLDKSVERMN